MEHGGSNAKREVGFVRVKEEKKGLKKRSSRFWGLSFYGNKPAGKALQIKA